MSTSINKLQNTLLNLEKITSSLKKTSPSKAATGKKPKQLKATSTKTTTAKTATSTSLDKLTSQVKNGVNSNESVINQFKGKIPDEQLNMIKLQQELENRSQAVNIVTNMLRTMHEMAMSVIRNFRVNA